MKYCWIAIALGGCPQPTVPGPVLDVSQCVLDTVNADVKSGMPQEAAEIDAAAKCLGHYTVENKAEVHRIYLSKTMDAGVE